MSNSDTLVTVLLFGRLSFFLYWNGQWIELLRASLGFAYADAVEEYVEIYTTDGFHFNVPRSGFRRTKCVNEQYCGQALGWS